MHILDTVCCGDAVDGSSCLTAEFHKAVLDKVQDAAQV